MLMMLARQPVEGERLLDRFLDPCDELRITRAPFGDPGGEVVAVSGGAILPNCDI